MWMLPKNKMTWPTISLNVITFPVAAPFPTSRTRLFLLFFNLFITMATKLRSLALALGPFIYYVSTFLPTVTFSRNFGHFSSSLCILNSKMKISSKCSVEKEFLLFWQKNPVFVKILELKLSFVLYKCLHNIWMVPSGLFSLVRSSWSRWGHLFSRVAIGSYVYLQLIHVNNMRAISKLKTIKDYFSNYINIEAHFVLVC